MSDRTYIRFVLRLFEETILLGPPFPTFRLHVTHETLNLTPSQLLIRPWTNQRPRPKPKTQYTILGPYPYIVH